MTEKPIYPQCCESCFNRGLFTCKKILNYDETCMFYTTKDTNKIFLEDYEDK